VLFPSARAPDAETITATLSLLTRAILEQRDDRWVLHVSDRAAIEVGMTASPQNAAEAWVAVDQHAGPLPDRAAIAAYDARFELVYTAGSLDEVFNPLSVTAARLARLTGGIVYRDHAFQL
jgi:hypothetical protein